MATLNADDFVRLVTIQMPEKVTALTFSPDGSVLAVATEDKVHLYRVPAEAKGGASAAPAPPRV